MDRGLGHAFGAFVVPALGALGLWLGGWWVLLPVVWFAGLAAVLDLLLPEETRFRVPPGGTGGGWVVWAMFPLLAGLLAYALHLVAAGAFTVWEFLGAALAVGLVQGSVGLTAAHELIHRPLAWERGLGVAISSLVLWAVFRIEHVHGHHRTVGTPEDPTTARLGESLYAYIPRAVLGGLTESWRLERERLHRRGMGTWHWRNRNLHYALLQGALLVGVTLWAGLPGLLFFVIQAWLAVQLLMTTGYIEHYGLLRRPNGRGGWERIGAEHSWNSGHRLTNWTTFNLGLHAEHHRWPGKAFPELVDDLDAMRMPFGYPGMALLAMVPPLWFRVMDPLVLRARAPA